MLTVTVQQIQELDRSAIEKFGVPSLVLMENAGRAVAEEVLRQIGKKSKPLVGVICGLGNNAGDGFVAARHLWNAGAKVKVFIIGPAARLKHDAAVNYRILKNARYAIEENAGSNLKRLEKFAAQADVVVDAIFGVGLNREVKEPFRQAIETINASARRIVAVDIPSGLDGTSGKIYGVCVKARTTVTFSFAKSGFFKKEGPEYTGEVVVEDIGIPKFMSISNKNIDQVIRILRRELRDLPDPSVTLVGKRWRDPFLVLMSCILSLRTKDETTLPASERLFALAKTPKAMLKLPTREIEQAIYPVGFYRTKARNIHAICQALLDRFNGQVPDDLEELLTLQGVGRKTANLVLTEGFGKLGVCVDTHVHRISNRFGYVQTRTPHETEMILRKKLPQKYWIEYNALLVMWGQNICKPVSPFCSRCRVRPFCQRRFVAQSR